MHTYPITLIAASFLGLILLYLSINVVRLRWSEKVSLGGSAKENPRLFKAVRAHSNFIEYVPTVLIILGLLESKKASTSLLITISVLLVIGRLLHLFGLQKKREVNNFRIVGSLATFMSLLIACLGGVYIAFFAA
ncbi:MAPEG family protein [Temperatibacter marinus]|uniref:MAPEG family protein n=1 Tax=Temperatibacter marinus TaxID=1456591 RepID=A0AA52EFS1_9PROT|nr:MAPEG family protein [Temperatibacter marinus]WND02878.1 MAPEG family protein [Temperatibacter marinus]